MSETKRDPLADLELCEAATPGPWTGECGSLVNWRDGTFTMEFVPNRGGKPQYDADLNFMAMAREALPWYIRAYLAQRDELEQLRAENDSLHVVLQEANDTIERMSREQSEESALARLRAWSTVYRLVSLRVSDGLPLLVLEDLKQVPTARVSVWDRPWKHGAPPADDHRYITLGTEDKPASLGEMVDAALTRWAELYGDQ